mmetsp:Transcript_79969/g.129615  ORF Transcript_79969/g.129615 Transcript_79969/m.129615 type:complete len:201 (+) Transcript_79969:131-733(+)
MPSHEMIWWWSSAEMLFDSILPPRCLAFGLPKKTSLNWVSQRLRARSVENAGSAVTVESTKSCDSSVKRTRPNICNCSSSPRGSACPLSHVASVTNTSSSEFTLRWSLCRSTSILDAGTAGSEATATNASSATASALFFSWGRLWRSAQDSIEAQLSTVISFSSAVTTSANSASFCKTDATASSCCSVFTSATAHLPSYR